MSARDNSGPKTNRADSSIAFCSRLLDEDQVLGNKVGKAVSCSQSHTTCLVMITR
jgi:hypothetical protein